MAVRTLIKTNQYLSFRLGAESYAIDVANAREIVECCGISQIPDMPDWIRGVINLRGSVLPVLDLKQKFGMGLTEQTKHTCIIVVEIVLEGDPFIIGVLADAVQEVFELAPSEIEPPPRFGTRISTAYLRGVSRRNERFYIILDADRIFTSGDLAHTEQAIDESEALVAADCREPVASGAEQPAEAH